MHNFIFAAVIFLVLHFTAGSEVDQQLSSALQE